MATAALFAIAALVWVAGERMPGGRWLSVHLFTLGVVTPLILAFSHHQAHALLRTPGRSRAGTRAMLVTGVVALATGVAAASAPLVAAGATVVGAAVTVSWRRLRRARKAAPDARFAWVVRAYERAHGAFLHGAFLGLLLGTGLIPSWAYVEVRQAHLHAMVLGFAVVTLLATAVLYGPMLLRAQLVPGAEERARRHVRHTATAASVVVLALLLAAAPGGLGTAGRWIAAGGLVAVAVHAAGVLRPLAATVRHKAGRAPIAGVLLTAAVGWLVLVALADAVVVATGAWRQLTAIGVAVLLGALAQAIVATLTHVVTTFLSRPWRRSAWRVLAALPPWTALLPQLLVLWLALRSVRW